MSVSYTHLDVYKRQIYNMCRAIEILRPADKAEIQKVKEEYEAAEALWQEQRERDECEK